MQVGGLYMYMYTIMHPLCGVHMRMCSCVCGEGDVAVGVSSCRQRQRFSCWVCAGHKRRGGWGLGLVQRLLLCVYVRPVGVWCGCALLFLPAHMPPHHQSFGTCVCVYLCVCMCAGAPRLITALHVASYHNQEDMVQLLLDKGIKVGWGLFVFLLWG